MADALRHGQLNVVVDDPPSGAFGEQNHAGRAGRAGGRGRARRRRWATRATSSVNLVQQTLDGLSPSALQQRLAAQGSGVLILPCDTDSQLSLAAAGARYGTLMLAACNYEPAAAQHYPTYWPVGSAANEEVAELATYMSTEGFPRVFVVGATGTHYVEALTSDFKQAVQSKHIRDRRERVGRDEHAGLHLACPGDQVRRTKADGGLHGASAAGREPARRGAAGAGRGRDAFRHLRHGRPLHAHERIGRPRKRSLRLLRLRRAKTPLRSNLPATTQSSSGRLRSAAFPGSVTKRCGCSRKPQSRLAPRTQAAIQQALARGLTLHGIALADRRYVAGSDHNPVSEVGVEKIAGRNFEPLLAGSPDGAPPGA